MVELPDKFTFHGALKFRTVTAERLESFPYKHLILLCDSEYRRQYAATGQNYTDIQDIDWRLYKMAVQPEDYELIDQTSDCYRVRPLYKNVMAQIAKCDAPAMEPQNDAIDLTMKFCKSYFENLRSTPSHNVEDHSYELDTSAGLPFIKMGVRSKRVALETRYDEVFNFAYDLGYPSIDTYNDKDELLDKTDLIRGKCRGIFSAPLHGIYREKFLYGLQNNKLLASYSRGWIKYGLVKQYGGFSKAIHSLERFSFIWESDVSGYDRHIYLKRVYELRNFLLDDVNLEFQDLIESVTENNIRPTVLLPNGYVVKRPTGNDSGKNNTTTDNSLSHFIIMIYMFVKRLQEIGVKPSLSYIFDNAELLIYSDDKIGGMTLDKFGWDTPQEFLSYEKQIYLEWGLECKESSQVFSSKEEGAMIPSKHSFLGSFTHYDDSIHMYIPYPRLGKICASITQKYSNKSVEIRFMRLLNLVLNCYPNPLIFAKALKYLIWFYKQNPDYIYRFDEVLLDVDLDLYLEKTFSTIYLGFEAKSSVPSYESPPCKGGVSLTVKGKILNIFFFPRFIRRRLDFKTSMTAVVTRAERSLNRIVKASQSRSSNGESGICGLTSAGKDFLIQTTDPRHDTPFKRIVGWPDSNTNPSNKFLIKYQMNVAAPIGTTAPWDLHIASVPNTDIMPYLATTFRDEGAFGYAGAPATALFGGVMARGVPSGTPVNWFPPSGDVSILNQQGLDTGLQKGISRVIGHSFEIKDTTAVLNRQGACTTYCQSEQTPEPVSFIGFNTVAAGASVTSIDLSGTLMRLPPTSASQAMLYPDSRQWKSEEGAYIVARFQSTDNPAHAPSYDEPLWYVNTTDQANTYGTSGPVSNTFQFYFPASAGFISQVVTIGLTPVTFTKASYPATKIHNYHVSGAIFSTLNPGSTFTVDVSWIVEAFPGPAETNLLTLATPSDGFDSVALDLFSHVLSDMPVAVKAGENFGGGWFDAIVDKVADWAGPLGAALGTIVPGASLIGQGLSSGAKALQGTRTNLPNAYVPPNVSLMQPRQIGGAAKKRKKGKKKNMALATGNRGKKGNIQGPMRS
jgi:hypothetical protein